jgi:hypothetical protein
MQLVAQVAPLETPSYYDGKNKEGKQVSNPTIGFGTYMHRYADGSMGPMFRLGISSNSVGFSIYVLGLKDKTSLKERFATVIGKAKVTGYCLQFKKLSDLNASVLLEFLQFGLIESNA